MEIRLLSFTGDCRSFAESPRISLAAFRTGCTPRYVALSYAWGDRQEPLSIIANSQIMYVQPGCEFALRQLQTLTPFRVQHFWIDALCINQADEAEKGHQVQMMARIFGGADAVAISYGADTDATSVFMRDLTFDPTNYSGSLAEDNDGPAKAHRSTRVWSAQKQYSNRARETCGSTQPPLLYSVDAFQVDSSIYTALQDLGSRRFWSRLWVVQELLMARQTVVLHDDGDVSLDTLYQFASGFARDLQELRDDVGARWAARLHALPMMRLITQIKYLQNAAGRGTESQHITFHTVLKRFAHLECGEDRDRVYALNNILPLRQEGILNVDYTITRRELAIEVLQSCARCQEPDMIGLADLLRGILIIGLAEVYQHHKFKAHYQGMRRPSASTTLIANTQSTRRVGSITASSEQHDASDSSNAGNACNVRLQQPLLYVLTEELKTFNSTSLNVVTWNSCPQAYDGNLAHPCSAPAANSSWAYWGNDFLPRLLAHRYVGQDYRMKIYSCSPDSVNGCPTRVTAITCAKAELGDMLVSVPAPEHRTADDSLRLCVVLRRTAEVYAIIGYAYLFSIDTWTPSKRSVTLALHPSDLLDLSCVCSQLPGVETTLAMLAMEICQDTLSSWAIVHEAETMAGQTVNNSRLSRIPGWVKSHILKSRDEGLKGTVSRDGTSSGRKSLARNLENRQLGR